MTDPRLNSVHLELPRRQDFRTAREALLNARGEHTLCAEVGGACVPAAPHQTVVEEPAGAPVNAKFVLMDKDYVYPLKVGLNTIGRMPDNDVVLEDAYVSRRHCAILVHAGDGCELYDIASKNGTFLNGQKIDGPTRLKTGDEIRMCNKHLVFVSRAAGPEHPGVLPTRSE